MSHLLTALKKSDAKHTEQTTPNDNASESVKIVHPMRTVKAQRSKPKWVLPIALSLLPALSIVCYKLYQQQQSVVRPSVKPVTAQLPVAIPVVNSILQAPPKEIAPAVAKMTGDVIFMSYPQLVTEPLPVSDSGYTASPADNSYRDQYGANRSSTATYSDDEPHVDFVDPYDHPSAIVHKNEVEDTSTNNSHDPYQLDNLDLSVLSPDIAAKLKSAIVATDGEQFKDNELDRTRAERAKPSQPKAKVAKNQPKVIPIGLLPTSIQKQLPKMNFSQHIYSSTPANRWVKVNGQEHHQGDMIASGVKLVKIEARDVILEFNGHKISMPALSEW